MRKEWPLLLSFPISLLQAQGVWSIKGGNNFSAITGSSNFSTAVAGNYSTTTSYSIGPRISFHFGLLYRTPLNNHFYIQPELCYSLQGGNVSSTTYIGDFPELGSYTLKANFLDQPILIGYKTKFGLFAETGPQWGLLVTAKEDYDAPFTANHQFTALDFSWVFGIGFINRHQVGFDIRYAQGINYSYQNGNQQGRNIVIQLDFFFKILAKRRKN